ncbi:hypothetical protein JVT61DRAFT_12139 [Boletus reticuloceps]|uniref:Uncharacterized protein n=1 Tax=Boletus reticuloceps TaxID=495285 RepID=A0A8I2YEI3_9AGAM|nr:hypothetical protein JVT61DRAFT_12139 [Boletus reticuloceps]
MTVSMWLPSPERESADTQQTQEHLEEENPMAGIGEDSAAWWDMGTIDTDHDLHHPSEDLEPELNPPQYWSSNLCHIG